MATHMKIRVGDTVTMLSGKDRTKTGKVIHASPVDSKVRVEGLNTVMRSLRSRKQGQKGQKISSERFVPVSSVALVCPSCKKQTRVGHTVAEIAGKKQKQRICKKCGKALA
ncbi:MAG: 50S ribosomal protein L24 [Patescibacteria group bacterium]